VQTPTPAHPYRKCEQPSSPLASVAELIEPIFMLRFPMSKSSKPETTATPIAKTGTERSSSPHPLDALTGGVFSAATSGERASRIRQWLATEPGADQLADVYKDLANRDKGAARPLKEKLDEIKRSKGQEAVAAEWAGKAGTLLAASKLNLADALAWQRDAAKAGAPLSREPLAGLKVQLAERVKTIEDLQHRTQVQREAAVLIAQRIEVLSIKPWRDAQAALETLQVDVAHWQAQADEITHDLNWASVDAKFPPLLDASRAQLLVVWGAFQAAIEVAVKAAEDSAAPLPAVPVWAEELRAARGQAPASVIAQGARPSKVKIDPAVLKDMREKAAAVVQEALARLEHEVTEGHGKATPKVAADLRQALKENIRNIDSKLEAAAHAALSAAGELEGWQRWRADQIREELVHKAEALAARPMAGRKQQDALRMMREQWKTSDQGGTPNHALWKRFDDACNEAHKVVEAWLETVKEQTEATKAQRRALIDEVLAWSNEVKAGNNTDWKMHIRSLNGFVDKWREAGHLSEKVFAEIQPQWKAAMDAADAPLTAVRNESLARRKAMIEEAQLLGAEPQLRIDAVKALQQRWQHEAQSVPIERKQEQKLWDAFRKPIDDAFQRKSLEREKAAVALGEFDRMVLEASKAVEAATASGDVQQIHAAAKALEAIVRGQVPVAAAPASGALPVANAAPAAVAPVSEPKEAVAQELPAYDATEKVVEQATPELPAGSGATPVQDQGPDGAAASAPAEPAPKAAPKPVVAMRGDDRPGMRKAEAAPAGRGGKFGDRKDSRGGGGSGGKPGGPRQSTDNKFEPYRGDRDERGPRADDRGERNARPPFEDRGPRLGDAAFRAQREAFEAANMALKKLAVQAHGEVLTHLLGAWENRDPAQLPGAQELGKAVTPAVRGKWLESLGKPSGKDASEALLRLEMAAELPTPAEHISARRMLQLQLLTRRNAPAPSETWGEDAAQVLAADFDAGNARRVQNALKVLLKR
jgi:ATP-dependent RNA helicase SUPV3L1/SUV3